jgi:hypothetical protein
MRNFLGTEFATPVKNGISTNTFSAQSWGNMMESCAQTPDLSPASKTAGLGVWVSQGICTHQSRASYTLFPTAIFGQITLSEAQLSPQSTGPIKKTTNYIKELLGVSTV